MNLDDIESIDFRVLGGADNIVVGDLSGTDLTQAGLDLRGPDGGGDGASDSVTKSPVPTAPTRSAPRATPAGSTSSRTRPRSTSSSRSRRTTG